MARSTWRNEFIFFISVFTPSSADPAVRMETPAAQRAFLHVAVADFEVPNQLADLLHIAVRLATRSQIRLRHDLDQRHATPVEIQQRASRILVMKRLAGVLLDVNPRYADAPQRIPLQLHVPVFAQGILVLRNLVPLRQVRDRNSACAPGCSARQCGSAWQAPMRIAYSTTREFSTGSVPGCPRLTASTWLLGSPPNCAESGLNALEAVLSWQ